MGCTNIDINKLQYINKTFYTKYGTPFTVKEYNNHKDILIEFEFSGIQMRTNLKSIKEQTIRDPFYKNNGSMKPFTFVNKEDEFLGRVFTNSYGEQYKIVEYKNFDNITVEFLDEHRFRATTNFNNIKNGGLANPFRKNTFGGYSGAGTPYGGRKYMWLITLWNNLLVRCNRKDMMHSKGRHDYDNCFMSEEWLNYSIFSVDYMEMYLQLNPNFKYNIDKDLLYENYKQYTNGAKYYSKNTVVLLPEDINIGIRNMDKNQYLIKYPYRYNLQIQRFEDFINRINWYKANNGLSDIAYIELIKYVNRKIEFVKSAFPEYERMRLEKIKSE